MTDLSSELAFARELAEIGGRIAMGHFGHDPETKRKADGTWVTEADWAVEAQIRLRIARTFPDHNILGEEEGLTRAGGGQALPGAPTWVVDPIDGTHNYMYGIPVWATLVGLRIGDESVVGVCHAPALGETYEAARGSGARLNGVPIHVDENVRIEDAVVIHSSIGGFLGTERWPMLRRLAEMAWRDRGFGDFWGHMLVARGAAHVMVEANKLGLWDVCALQPIVAEAGGTMTDLNGEPWTSSGPCLTTNGTLHAAVLALGAQP